MAGSLGDLPGGKRALKLGGTKYYISDRKVTIMLAGEGDQTGERESWPYKRYLVFYDGNYKGWVAASNAKFVN